MTDLERERPHWESGPADTVALVVVADEYAGFDPIEGIAQQATRFVSQLIRYGVDPQHIMLLASETARGAFPAGTLWLGPAEQRNIDKVIQKLPVLPRGLLWVHWIGHGVYENGEMRLLTAEAEPQLLSVVVLETLREQLELGDGLPEHQILTIDACQQNWAGTQPILLRKIAHSGSNAAQIVARASRPGDAASTEARGGLFTEALMGAIDEISEPDRWPPDVTRLAGALTKQLREALGGKAGRTQWVTTTPWEGTVNRTAELQPGGGWARDRRRSLVAWAVPNDWCPGIYHPRFGSNTLVALDLRLVLDRAPAAAFVADRPDADLAADLNRAEETLDNSTLDGGAPRHWFTVDAKRHGDPASVRDLGPLVLEQRRWRQNCRRAFVLRLDIADVSVSQQVWRDEAAGWLRRITGEFPGASIAVAARAGYAIDAILAVRQLARELSVGPLTPARRDVLTRSRPGEPMVEGGTTRDVTGPPFVPAVLDRLRTAARQRQLHFPFTGIADAAVQIGEDTPPSPAALAFSLVEEIEAPAFAWPDTEPRRDPDEAFLCAVRDFTPELFPHLVRAYAAKRTGAGWGVSLAVAAQFDQDVATWLSAAMEAGRRPDLRDRSDWPPVAYRRVPADAVVLELARRDPPGPPGQPWAGDAWLPLTVSSSVAETIRLLRLAPSASRPVIELSQAPCDLITSLAAAVLDPVSLLGPDPDRYTEQTWCAVRASARSPGGLWPMLRLLTEGAARGFARAVIGLEPLSNTAEELLQEEADQLHRFLHSISGGES